MQRRIGIPRRDKEWRKVGGSVQWRGIRDEKRALRKVEDRGVTGEGARVCGGVVGWMVWAGADGWETLGLRRSGELEGASLYEIKGMDGFRTVRREGKRKADRLVGGGTVRPKGKGRGRRPLRVVAIACLWFSICQMLSLHDSFSCEGEMVQSMLPNLYTKLQ